MLDSRGCGVTDAEKRLMLDTIVLLENATSNSLNPEHRKSWSEARDEVIERLKQI